MQPIAIRRSHPRAQLPIYATDGSAGMDLCSVARLCIQPGQWLLVPTGLQVALPRGYEMQIRPRSGIALKHGVTVLNAPGTIDSDYRGEIGVILINLGPLTYKIHPGDRIAQMVPQRTHRVVWREKSKDLEKQGFQSDKTARGCGGFGSTDSSL